MKLRISQTLYADLKRARAWSGASIAEIARRAWRRYGSEIGNVVLDDFRDCTTTGGTCIDVPKHCTAAVLVWYLSHYDIPDNADAFTTELREGIDYLVDNGEDKQ